MAYSILFLKFFYRLVYAITSHQHCLYLHITIVYIYYVGHSTFPLLIKLILKRSGEGGKRTPVLDIFMIVTLWDDWAIVTETSTRGSHGVKVQKSTLGVRWLLFWSTWSARTSLHYTYVHVSSVETSRLDLEGGSCHEPKLVCPPFKGLECSELMAMVKLFCFLLTSLSL